ncbi:hypothetical protein ACFQ15_12560 [Sphingomonas hankookensis]|uniref:hypothetical protein n=1 Tax=Sphingomonas hankookensis TaxID=563996 RepID=UPI001F59E08F|nr:hypothetical protein [Sphingomonas hankookensis]
MARLNKEGLFGRVIDAIVADGWHVERFTGLGVHPARFAMRKDGVEHVVRLYIWNLSHGGKSRSAEEFRIQVTGIDGFEVEPNGRTLILGFSQQFGVFAGFDIYHRLKGIGVSPSIQITAATLLAAADHGAEKQDKTKSEWAIAIRPDRVARYIQHLSSAHTGDIGPLLADAQSPFADALSSEIASLAETAAGFDLSRPGEVDLRANIEAGVDGVLAALGEGPTGALAQIGHNQPPEPIEEPPSLGSEIKDAAEQIRDHLKSDTVDPREIGRRGALLAWARKILDAAKSEGAKVLEKGKDIAREYMAKALWGGAGTVGMIFKEEIVEALRHLAGSVLNWLQHIVVF